MKSLPLIIVAIILMSLGAWKWYAHSSCLRESDCVKMVIFAPITHADAIRTIIGKMGAGKIENYAFCSFSIQGTGRWIALEGSHAAAGEIGTLEENIEERIEFICPKAMVKPLLQEVARIHPYDTLGYDIYPMLELEN